MSSSVISHGRRKGSLKSTSPPERCAPVKPGQVAVITGAEWSRIRGCAVPKNSVTKPLNDREELHKRSKSIVKNWDNTIEGQRLKKLEARKIREEKEEAERVKVDLEEAEFQSAQRKEAIERAKTLLYYQTDRVKQFHEGLMLSEVLRERDKQVDYKLRRADAVKRQDDRFIAFESAQREVSLKADLEAAKERAKQKAIVTKYQQNQASGAALLKTAEREAALREQAKLDQETVEFHEQRKALEERQHAARLEHRKALDQWLTEKQENERIEKQKETEKEEEIKIFAKAKKKMTAMRKAKEEELFKEFQVHQTKMCDLLATQMAQASSDEDKRIAQAVVEQEAKKLAEQRTKEERFMERSHDIQQFTRLQLMEQAAARREQRETDEELLKQRIIQDQKFHGQQLDKARKTGLDAMDRQDFLKLQIKEMNARKRGSRNEEKDMINKNMELLKVEEGQFQQYADGVITEAAARGGHIIPLIKAAVPGAGGGHGRVFSGKGGMRPSYKATDSTAMELPSFGLLPETEHKNTQQRMGFTW